MDGVPRVGSAGWAVALALVLPMWLVMPATAQARTQVDPIEGTWGDGGGGEVTVTADGAKFVGTVTKTFPGQAGNCLRIGIRVWEIDPAGGGKYSGAVVGYVPDCSVKFSGFGTWQLGAGGTSLHQCSDFGIGAPVCTDLKRMAVLSGGQATFAISGWAGVGTTLGAGYRSTTAGGRITFEGSQAHAKGALVFRFRYAGGKTVTLQLVALGVAGKPELGGPTKTVVFRVGILKSGLSGCPVGKTGSLTLSDSSSNQVVNLAICGRTRSYNDKIRESPPPPPGSSFSVLISPS